MTGQQFREARSAAGLTYRAAAERLGVSLSTIQRWESGAAIPSEAAERIRQLAQPADVATGHALGRLYAILEQVIAERVPISIANQVPGNPGAAFGRFIAYARRKSPGRYAEYEPEIAAILSTIHDYPDKLGNAADGQFWLGYYHQRADARADRTGVSVEDRA